MQCLNAPQSKNSSEKPSLGLLARLQRRGVLRVAVGYAVIAWLLLQIGDVVLEPLDAPAWVMRALITLVISGFPIALILAWFFELGPGGISVDHLPEGAHRPAVTGLRRYADVAIIGVLLGVIVLLVARQGGLLQEETGTPVIGVLPFTEQGTAPEDAYFGAGLADTLSYKLGQLRQILVLAPSSTREFAGSGQDLARIGAMLGASALLEGTVRRAAGSLKVNARLVDIQSGQQLWSGSYDRSGTDLFAVQDEIATAVTEALHLVLSPEDKGRVTHTLTESLSAYDAYLLGHSRLATRDRAGRAMVEAVEYFRRAVKIDPEYALAHAGLAEALFLATGYSGGELSWPVVADEAKEAAARAQAIDPNLGEGYLAQAFSAMGENEYGDGSAWPQEFIAALLKRAVELSPNSAMAWKFYANYTDDSEEKMARLQTAARLDPRSGIILENLASRYLRQGDTQSARYWYRRSLRTAEPYFMLGLQGLLDSYTADELDYVARWGRAIAPPDLKDDFTWLVRFRGLLEIGAWDELEAVVTGPSAPMTGSPGRLPAIWWATHARLERARGQLEAGAVHAERFHREFLMQQPAYPDISAFHGPASAVLDILALRDIEAGVPEKAHERYELLFPNLQQETWIGFSDALNGRVISAAIHKMLGDRERAEAELRDYLVELAALPPEQLPQARFIPFTIHAMLGETDAAIAALQTAVDANVPWAWWGWWALKDGAFDPDYAAVLADPRYQAIYAGMESKLSAMRESYQANPELSEEDRREAGL
jgi:TolB-like protein